VTTQLKQRLVGGVVLLALLAIFLPIFFSQPHPTAERMALPAEPSRPVVELKLPKLVEHADTRATKPMAYAHDDPIGEVIAAKATANAVPAAEAMAPVTMAKAQDKAQSSTKNLPAAKTKAKPELAVVASKPPAVVVVPKVQGAWVVQVATFSRSDYAKALVKRLRKAGLEAYTRVQVRRDGRRLTQVFVGPVVDKARLDQLKIRLNTDFKLKGLVRRYQA
jgi:DedD protein